MELCCRRNHEQNIYRIYIYINLLTNFPIIPCLLERNDKSDLFIYYIYIYIYIHTYLEKLVPSQHRRKQKFRSATGKMRFYE